ncbi:MAG: hypothetical protein RLZZ127_1521 [Planctomycetota bacterium]|jgi:hypothetical protein
MDRDAQHRNAILREQEALTPEEIAAERQARRDAEATRGLTKFAGDGSVVHRGADWNYPIGWREQEL